MRPLTVLDPAGLRERGTKEWTLSTLPSVEMLPDFDLAPVLRNFDECRFVWAYTVTHGPLKYDALVTTTAAELHVSERWAREIISRLRDSLFLLSVDFSSRMFIRASYAFALLVDLYSDFGYCLASLARQTKGFGITELVNTALFEDLKMSENESRFDDTFFFDVSDSTFQRSIKLLQDLGLVETRSPQDPLRCTPRGKLLAAGLCSVCYVAMAEEMS